jgi:hypothetical protein
MKEIPIRSTPMTVYDWVACVARIVPEATFSAGESKRDRLHRVVVETPWMHLECVVEEDKSEAVRDRLYAGRKLQEELEHACTCEAPRVDCCTCPDGRDVAAEDCPACHEAMREGGTG